MSTTPAQYQLADPGRSKAEVGPCIRQHAEGTNRRTGDVLGQRDVAARKTHCRFRAEVPPTDGGAVEGIRAGRGIAVVQDESAGPAATRCTLRGQDPEGCQAGRSADGTANALRTGRQPDDGQCHRLAATRDASSTGGRLDRIGRCRGDRADVASFLFGGAHAANDNAAAPRRLAGVGAGGSCPDHPWRTARRRSYAIVGRRVPTRGGRPYCRRPHDGRRNPGDHVRTQRYRRGDRIPQTRNVHGGAPKRRMEARRRRKGARDQPFPAP